MARSKFYVVTDDPMLAMRARQLAESCGAEAQVYSPHEWETTFTQNTGTVPSLSHGQDTVQPVEGGGKVLPFPGHRVSGHQDSGSRVESINEIESKAIENAIHVYKGNLTEAAKALGIGRATLYRKVKQYNIDPQQARRRRAA